MRQDRLTKCPSTVRRLLGGRLPLAVRARGIRLGLVGMVSVAGLALATASAGAAVAAPLVSTSTSHSASSTVTTGTTLTANFNEAPTLAGSYSLTLTDGTDVGTVSSGHNLSAVVSGTSITFTATGPPSMAVGSSLSLSSPVEVIGSTGINDPSGNPWNLIASGQVDKADVLASGDTVTVQFNKPVTIGLSYSLTLREGSSTATIDQNDSNAAVSGNTITYNVTGSPSGTVAADGPTASAFTGVSAVPTVQAGDALTHDFPAATITVGASPYSVSLQDGSLDTATLSTANGNLGTPTAVSDGSGGTLVTYPVTGAPTMSSGVNLFTAGLQATAEVGLTSPPATPFPLAVSGPGTPAPSVSSVNVTIDPNNTCTNIAGFTRVFGGSNCDISPSGGPVAPDVFDVIPLPTTDLPGINGDHAPEVITTCAAGSTDLVYDVNTGAELGSAPCGTGNPAECTLPLTNTCGPTLDYIPTPNLASFEEAGVVETIPGSNYISATAVPPQISAVNVSGSHATFTYFNPVVCQDSGDSGGHTSSQFTYITPYTNLNPGERVYATSISCPSGSGSTSLTVNFGQTIPVASGVRFKFEGYGPGSFIVGAPGSPFAFEREASESAYAGPTATIDAFTPQSTTTSTSAGGAVNISIGTTDALTCSLGGVSFPAGAAGLSLPAVSCNGGGTITVPANASFTSNVVYTVTLTAVGVPGTPPAKAQITITVPAAPLPPPSILATPTITGTAAVGQTLTEAHGSWSNNPTSYSYQWEDCTAAGTGCVAIPGATAQAYTVSPSDENDKLVVLEVASNSSGAGTAAASSPTATVPVPVPAPGNTTPLPPAPHTGLLKAVIKVHAGTATFKFKATGKSTGFRCALVLLPTRKHARTPKPKYAKCGSTKVFTHLKSGHYILYARSVGPGGTGNTITHRFTIQIPAKHSTKHRG